MDMVKTGFIFNILGVLLVTIFMFTLGQLIFDIDLNAMPDWAELAAPTAKE